LNISEETKFMQICPSAKSVGKMEPVLGAGLGADLFNRAPFVRTNQKSPKKRIYVAEKDSW
jgi:hypothetical protein